MGTSLPSAERVNLSKVLFLLFLIVLTGCSKEDDLPETEDSFYKDALISASEELLAGTWSIFEVSYQGKYADIPATYEECGRDFFQFISSGTYREYILTSGYECQKQILDLSWELEKGVVRLQNSWGESDEMVILQLNTEKLVFKMKMDIDEDGEQDVLTFVARRYAPPNDLDIYSYTFGSTATGSGTNEIKFTWQPYEGFYEFDRYEIYRSNSGCSKANAELVATIENSSENFFTDLDPPAMEEICYYFRIYNNKGLIGESELSTFFTDYLLPTEVQFANINAVNNEIEMRWQPYGGNYFSHYRITVRNYKGGTGSGYQEYPVAIIEDKEVTTFLDENPPRLKNPVYAIYAYDIFGNMSSHSGTDGNSWELNWSHPEVLNFDSVQFATMEQDKPEIFLYGREQNGQGNLIKYNYQNNEISATANKLPEAMTSIPMQLHNSDNGRELFFPQGNALTVYDANDLSYKYKLTPGESAGYTDFAYLGNNIFSFTTGNVIYTYKRNNANLEFIEKKEHFTTHWGTGNYHLVLLKDQEILVGHFREAQSFKFVVSSTGKISDGEPVNIPVKSHYQKKTLYSPEKEYVINLLENKLYSTRSFGLQESFESPYFPSGISRDGNLILGSNNDPQERITNESIHERKARIYNLTTGKLTTIESKGYPHLLFEDHAGQIISISSGFKRESLDKNAPKPDIFLEVIQ